MRMNPFIDFSRLLFNRYEISLSSGTISSVAVVFVYLASTSVTFPSLMFNLLSAIYMIWGGFPYRKVLSASEVFLVFKFCSRSAFSSFKILLKTISMAAAILIVFNRIFDFINLTLDIIYFILVCLTSKLFVLVFAGFFLKLRFYVISFSLTTFDSQRTLHLANLRAGIKFVHSSVVLF